MEDEEEEEKETFIRRQEEATQEGNELDEKIKEELKNAEQAMKAIENSQNIYAMQVYTKLIEEFNRATTDVDKVYN